MFTGVLLAGGKSSRMGFDKQILSTSKRNIQKLKWSFDDVMVISNKPYLYENEKVNQDIFREAGALGGIHSGLVHSETEYICVVACDMPYINLEYINYIKREVEREKPVVAVTRRGNHIEPFMGFYSKGFLDIMEQDLSKGLYSIKKAIEKVDAMYIPESKALEYSKDLKMFLNLNTKVDLEKYLLGE